MNRQPHFEKREAIVAEAIADFVSELRMVDVADYIAYLRMERIATLSDIVETAAELYFMPGTVRLGHGGEAHVGWAGEPRIVLDLELRPRGATVYFTLALTEKLAEIEVNFVSFSEAGGHPDENTARLRCALQNARFRPPVAIAAAR